jgi:hypothetical protein
MCLYVKWIRCREINQMYTIAGSSDKWRAGFFMYIRNHATDFVRNELPCIDISEAQYTISSIR